MPALGAKERAQLPDRALAYIDSRGRRRPPIHDGRTSGATRGPRWSESAGRGLTIRLR